MRKYTRRGPLGYGLVLVVLAALAIAGAASGNHWADYNGTADSHEVVAGNPPLCPPPRAGSRSASTANQLVEGGDYPAGNPVVRIFDLDVEGGTLSWELSPTSTRTTSRRSS